MKWTIFILAMMVASVGFTECRKHCCHSPRTVYYVEQEVYFYGPPVPMPPPAYCHPYRPCRPVHYVEHHPRMHRPRNHSRIHFGFDFGNSFFNFGFSK